MKRFIILVIAVLAFTLSAITCFASELDYDSVSSNIIVDNEFSDNFIPDDLDQDEFLDNFIPDDLDQEDIDTQFNQLSDNFVILSSDDLIELLSSYNSVTGVINEPYLTYIRSCLSWSSYNDNYVAFVSSYTYGNNSYSYYVVAIGDISYNGSYFIGSDVDVYSFYPNANLYGNYRHEIQSSFNYYPSSSLCFSDISSSFPDIRGQDTKFLYVILCIIALVIIFYTFTKFGFGNVHIRRRSAKPYF